MKREHLHTAAAIACEFLAGAAAGVAIGAAVELARAIGRDVGRLADEAVTIAALPLAHVIAAELVEDAETRAAENRERWLRMANEANGWYLRAHALAGEVIELEQRAERALALAGEAIELEQRAERAEAAAAELATDLENAETRARRAELPERPRGIAFVAAADQVERDH
jgi:hypothetical protein